MEKLEKVKDLYKGLYGWDLEIKAVGERVVNKMSEVVFSITNNDSFHCFIPIFKADNEEALALLLDELELFPEILNDEESLLMLSEAPDEMQSFILEKASSYGIDSMEVKTSDSDETARDYVANHRVTRSGRGEIAAEIAVFQFNFINNSKK